MSKANIKKGTLQIPAGANIIDKTDKELGRAYVVKTDTIICPHPKAIGDHKTITLNQGAKIFAEDVPDNPQVANVQVYMPLSQKNNDMSETKWGFTPGTNGYVLKETLQPDLSSGEEFRKIRIKSLFPNKSLMNDIKQYLIADCFLLSSIMAILALEDGADLIRGMMKMQNDGTTIVRFFDPDTLEPIYIRVSHSEFYLNGEKSIEHGAPWVHILEKAFAALAKKGHIYKENRNVVEYTDIISGMRPALANGGVPMAAFEILTGKPAVNREPPRGPAIPLDSSMLLYMKSISEENRTALLFDDVLDSIDAELKKLPIDVLEYISKLRVDSWIHYNILPESIRNIIDDKTTANFIKDSNTIDWAESRNDLEATKPSALISYVKYAALLLSDSCKSELTSYLTPANIIRVGDALDQNYVGLEYDKDFESFNFNEYESFVAFLDHYQNQILNGDEEERRRLTAIIKRGIQLRHEFNGPIGYGGYSDSCISVYNDLVKFKNNNPVVLSTKEDSNYRGLKPSHGYGVCDVFEGNHERKYVKVRNPWGHTGREEKFDAHRGETKSREIRDPVSTIDLQVFCRMAHYYTIGDVSRLRQIEAERVSQEKKREEEKRSEKEQRRYNEQRIYEKENKSEDKSKISKDKAQPIFEGMSPLEESVSQPKSNQQSKKSSPNDYKSFIYRCAAYGMGTGLLGGLVLGFIFAPVTFGASLIPILFATGSIGFCIGLVAGVAVGVVGATVMSSLKNLWNKLRSKKCKTEYRLVKQDVLENTLDMREKITPASNNSTRYVKSNLNESDDSSNDSDNKKGKETVLDASTHKKNSGSVERLQESQSSHDEDDSLSASSSSNGSDELSGDSALSDDENSDKSKGKGIIGDNVNTLFNRHTRSSSNQSQIAEFQDGMESDDLLQKSGKQKSQ